MSDPVAPTRYAGWGRGKYHIIRSGESTTVCGREVTYPAKGTIYQPAGCHRCTSDADALAAAEATRRADYETAHGGLEESRERNRQGVFTVYRCRKCGVQHARPGDSGGVAWCTAAFHLADIEEVEATGPLWSRP